MKAPRHPWKKARLPRKKPRQARSQATVDVILDAATRVFLATGFDEANTNVIAERAGVSIGSLYQYFPNKLALLAGVRERHLRHFSACLGLVCERGCAMPLPEAVRMVVDETVGWFVKQGALAGVFRRELPHPDRDDYAIEATRALFAAHRSRLRVGNLDEAVFFVHTMASSVMKAAACDRPADLRNGRISGELTTALLLYLTGAADGIPRGLPGRGEPDSPAEVSAASPALTSPA
ncbi:MAG: TetR/AcrR family transcriptional regulator [Opitutae bacterium]|nr:TetR/AcrR family transcriptional regulator [Opitutae bacterium]